MTRLVPALLGTLGLSTPLALAAFSGPADDPADELALRAAAIEAQLANDELALEAALLDVERKLLEEEAARAEALRARNDDEDARKQIQALHDELARAHAERADLEAALQDIAVHRADVRRESLEMRVRELEDRLAQAQVRHDERMAVEADREARAQALLETRLEALQVDAANLQAQRNDLAAAGDDPAAEAMIADLEAALASLDAHRAELEMEITKQRESMILADMVAREESAAIQAELEAALRARDIEMAQIAMEHEARELERQRAEMEAYALQVRYDLEDRIAQLEQALAHSRAENEELRVRSGSRSESHSGGAGNGTVRIQIDGLREGPKRIELEVEDLIEGLGAIGALDAHSGHDPFDAFAGGIAFTDVDDDGFVDLYVANGGAEACEPTPGPDTFEVHATGGVRAYETDDGNVIELDGAEGEFLLHTSDGRVRILSSDGDLIMIHEDDEEPAPDTVEIRDGGVIRVLDAAGRLIRTIETRAEERAPGISTLIDDPGALIDPEWLADAVADRLAVADGWIDQRAERARGELIDALVERLSDELAEDADELVDESGAMARALLDELTANTEEWLEEVEVEELSEWIDQLDIRANVPVLIDAAEDALLQLDGEEIEQLEALGYGGPALADAQLDALRAIGYAEVEVADEQLDALAAINLSTANDDLLEALSGLGYVGDGADEDDELIEALSGLGYLGDGADGDDELRESLVEVIALDEDGKPIRAIVEVHHEGDSVAIDTESIQALVLEQLAEARRSGASEEVRALVEVLAEAEVDGERRPVTALVEVLAEQADQAPNRGELRIGSEIVEYGIDEPREIVIRVDGGEAQEIELEGGARMRLHGLAPGTYQIRLDAVDEGRRGPKRLEVRGLPRDYEGEVEVEVRGRDGAKRFASIVPRGAHELEGHLRGLGYVTDESPDRISVFVEPPGARDDDPVRELSELVRELREEVQGLREVVRELRQEVRALDRRGRGAR